MEILDEFNEILDVLMLKKGINAKNLALATKIEESTICKWRTKKNSISLRHLIILADYFACSIDFLLGRSEEVLTFTIQEYVPFSKRIRQLIEESGYTRYRFTKETRFTDAHLYKWYKGSLPQLATLLDLADLFNCSLDYLIGREK